MIEREMRLARLALQNLVFLFASVCLGALVGAYFSTDIVARHKASAEIYVKYGNEFTVPSSVTGSDRQQVEIDYEVALNGEIQIITSWPVIRRALERAPHPEFQTDLEPVSDLVSATHVENSPVMVISVVDKNSEWLVGFLGSLIDEYLQRRMEMFEWSETRKDLAALAGELGAELVETRARIQTLRAGAPGASNGANTSAAETTPGELGLLVSQEKSLIERLQNVRSQEMKLDILSATSRRVEVLSAPRTSSSSAGLGRREFVILMSLIFLVLAASFVVIREMLRR